MNKVIALGTFDGVHRGHRQLIDQCVSLARSQGLRPLIYTFSNHPLEAFSSRPQLLMPNRIRIETLSSLCETVTVPFDRTYASMEPRDFAGMLQTEFSMQVAVAGFNYTFGDKGRGDMHCLKAFGEEMGFQVLEIPPCLYAGAPISSTRIRAAVSTGQMEEATAMLGRPYSMRGAVTPGRVIGHGLTLSTINFYFAKEQVLPAAGVYATWIEIRGLGHKPAVTNIGWSESVDGASLRVEIYVPDLPEDPQGEKAEVIFIKHLRDDSAFPSGAALAAQIGEDARIVQGLLQDA